MEILKVGSQITDDRGNLYKVFSLVSESSMNECEVQSRHPFFGRYISARLQKKNEKRNLWEKPLKRTLALFENGSTFGFSMATMHTCCDSSPRIIRIVKINQNVVYTRD
jgi:hypothetical protein